MALFLLRSDKDFIIRFDGYFEEAPATTRAFLDCLPFSRIFLHARISGPEIWNDNAPPLDIPQENASVFALAGEIAIAPIMPMRNRIRNCIGIFYDEGRLVDCANIFGRVIDEDIEAFRRLGDRIWKEGQQELHFERNN